MRDGMGYFRVRIGDYRIRIKFQNDTFVFVRFFTLERFASIFLILLEQLEEITFIFIFKRNVFTTQR
jgi:hypothetical protein